MAEGLRRYPTMGLSPVWEDRPIQRLSLLWEGTPLGDKQTYERRT
jgi:hypothetical protein